MIWDLFSMWKLANIGEGGPNLSNLVDINLKKIFFMQLPLGSQVTKFLMLNKIFNKTPSNLYFNNFFFYTGTTLNRTCLRIWCLPIIKIKFVKISRLFFNSMHFMQNHCRKAVNEETNFQTQRDSILMKLIITGNEI